jgi:hypothetical protein
VDAAVPVGLCMFASGFMCRSRSALGHLLSVLLGATPPTPLGVLKLSLPTGRAWSLSWCFFWDLQRVAIKASESCANAAQKLRKKWKSGATPYPSRASALAPLKGGKGGMQRRARTPQYSNQRRYRKRLRSSTGYWTSRQEN